MVFTNRRMSKIRIFFAFFGVFILLFVVYDYLTFESTSMNMMDLAKDKLPQLGTVKEWIAKGNEISDYDGEDNENTNDLKEYEEEPSESSEKQKENQEQKEYMAEEKNDDNNLKEYDNYIKDYRKYIQNDDDDIEEVVKEVEEIDEKMNEIVSNERAGANEILRENQEISEEQNILGTNYKEYLNERENDTGATGTLGENQEFNKYQELATNNNEYHKSYNEKEKETSEQNIGLAEETDEDFKQNTEEQTNHIVHLKEEFTENDVELIEKSEERIGEGGEVKRGFDDTMVTSGKLDTEVEDGNAASKEEHAKEVEEEVQVTPNYTLETETTINASKYLENYATDKSVINRNNTSSYKHDGNKSINLMQLDEIDKSKQNLDDIEEKRLAEHDDNKGDEPVLSDKMPDYNTTKTLAGRVRSLRRKFAEYRNAIEYEGHLRETNTAFIAILNRARYLSGLLYHPKIVLVSFICRTCLPYAYNWLCNTKELDFHRQTLLITKDSHTENELRKKWPEVNLMSLETNVPEVEFAKINKSKNSYLLCQLQLINSLLNAGVSVLWFDIRSVWLENPMPSFPKPASTNADMLVNIIPNSDINTGFLLLYGTDKTQSFWKELYGNLRRKWRENTDTSFPLKTHYKDLLLDMIESKHDTVTARRLPVSSYTDGLWYMLPEHERLNTHPVFIRNNYAKGTERIQRAKQWNHWFLQNDVTCNTGLVRKIVKM